MRVTRLSIPDFLELAVRAAESCGYSGVAVVVARKADQQSKLLQQLIADRASLDDVTGQEILVVVPESEDLDTQPSSLGAAQAAVLDPSKSWDAYVTPGLVLPFGVRQRLEAQFWKLAGEPEDRADTSSAEDFEQALGGPPNMFEDEIEPRLAVELTRCATATAQHLNLDESYIPCLCVLTLRDRQVFVFQYGLLDDLYAFFRRVVSSRQQEPEQSPLWLSDTLVAVASELKLAPRQPPDPPSSLAGWTYHCYDERPVLPASSIGVHA